MSLSEVLLKPRPSLRYQAPRVSIVRMPAKAQKPEPEPVRDFLLVATPLMPSAPIDLRTALYMPTIRGLLVTASRISGFGVQEILSPRRHKPIVLVRQCVMILARKFTTLSYPQIGRSLGNRDHSTVHHALNEYKLKPWRFNPLLLEICKQMKLLMEPVDNLLSTFSIPPNTDECDMV